MSDRFAGRPIWSRSPAYAYDQRNLLTAATLAGQPLADYLYDGATGRRRLRRCSWSWIRPKAAKMAAIGMIEW